MLAASVNLSETPEVLEMLDAYEAQRNRFGDGGELESTIIDDNPVYIRDYTKCVLCWRCVQVCAEDAQYTYAIDFGGRGFATSISTFLEKPLTETTCVFCGQCVGVCPSGALKAKREHFLEQGIEPEEIFEITRLSGRGKRSKVGPHLG
jgi:predicted molibdopterin-dependent oxidoreductase YjgC